MLVSVVHTVAILIVVFCVICSLLMFVSDASDDHMVEVQEDAACTRLDCCRNMHKSCLHNPCPIPFFVQGDVAPCRLTGSAPHKIGGRQVKSWPDDTHRQTHSSHLDL